MSKTIDDKYSTPISALHWVLGRRLRHSRSWGNVSIAVKSKTFEIRWCEPKNEEQADMATFMSRVLPLSIKSLDAEIDRQIDKYQEERCV